MSEYVILSSDFYLFNINSGFSVTKFIILNTTKQANKRQLKDILAIFYIKS